MQVIRNADQDHVVIGLDARTEFLGLLFCGLGLLTVILGVLCWFERQNLRGSAFLLFMAGIYLVPLGIAGTGMVFTQRRFIFHKPTARVYFKQGVFKDTITPYNAYRQIELIETNPKNAVVNIITTEGRRILMTRGPLEKAVVVAERISDCTGWPIEHTDARRKWMTRQPEPPSLGA